MKGKLSFMWRATLALVLVLSLGLVMGAPVAASPDVSNVWVQLDDYVESGSGVTYSIYFTPGADLTKDVDTISVLFDADMGTMGTVAVDVYPDGDLIVDPTSNAAATTINQAAARVTLETPVDISAGVQVRLDVSGITNPATDPADTEYTLDVYTSQELTRVTSSGYTIEETSAHPVGSVVFTPTPASAGASAEYVVGFTAATDLTTDWNTVTVIFPPEVTLPASMAASDVEFDGSDGSDDGSYTACTDVPTISGRFVTITVPEDVDVSGEGGEALVKFTLEAGIQNPTEATTGSAYVGKVYTSADKGIVDAGTGYDITHASISQLVFVTANSDAVVQASAVGALTAADLEVETQDEYGNAAAVGAEVTLELSSTSGTGLFENGSNGTDFADTTETIAADAGVTVGLQYRDTTVGSYTITVAESPSMGWTDATWDITVETHAVSLYDSNDVLIDDTYATIQDAINGAMAGDTIKVGPGTYTEVLRIETADLTIESTDGASSTTLYGTGSFVCEIVSADDVTIEGFTFEGTGLPAGDRRAIFVRGASGFTIQNNEFIGFNSDAITVTSISGHAITSGTIDTNTFTGMGVDGIAGGRSGINVESTGGADISGVEITNNTLSAYSADETNAIGVAQVSGAVSEITVQDNIISDSYRGISLWGEVTGLTGDYAISNNTITGCTAGFKASGSDTVEFDLVYNSITGNTLYGVWLHTATLTTQTVTIKYNDLSGNGEWGIYNAYTAGADVIATHNWWGDATGPSAGTGTYASTAVGSGDAVSVEVTYIPWLDAAGGDPLTTTDITLVAGWNLISLSLIPVDSDIDTVLAGAGTGVTVNKVAYFTGGPAGSWKSWFPSPTPIDLYTMDDGKGYWIDVSAAGELTVTGVELALPGQVPPTYDVVVGWNLIGFTSTATDKTVDVYLGSVFATVQAMYIYGADTGLYTAVLTGNHLVPGQGYWLAVDTAGKIYP